MNVNSLQKRTGILAETVKKKIMEKSAVVGVVGLGRTGLPLAVELAKADFRVLGFDQNLERVIKVNNGENYVQNVKNEELQALIRAGALLAGNDFDRLAEADVIVICVSTPLTAARIPDITNLKAVAREVAVQLRPGQLIVLESSVCPGTTAEVVLPLLNAGALRVGEDYFLAYSPERAEPAPESPHRKTTSKVVGGISVACREVATVFYQQTVLQVVPVSSPAAAEMIKTFENTYRAVNTALVNEMMLLCDHMGLDVWEVVDAADTQPFGLQTFYPGPGVGGAELPVDPFFLAWKAREYDFHSRLIETAGEVNIQASYHVVDKIALVLNDFNKAFKDARVFVIGAAYRKNSSDFRESPALKIIDLLRRKKAEVIYHDPYVPVLAGAGWQMESVDLGELSLRWADCVVILTDHSDLNYDFILQHSQAVVDSRNVTKAAGVRYQHKVSKI